MSQGTQQVARERDKLSKLQTIPAKGYAAKRAASPLGLFSFMRRAPRGETCRSRSSSAGSAIRTSIRCG